MWLSFARLGCLPEVAIPVEMLSGLIDIVDVWYVSLLVLADVTHIHPLRASQLDNGSYPSPHLKSLVAHSILRVLPLRPTLQEHHPGRFGSYRIVHVHRERHPLVIRSLSDLRAEVDS